MDTDHEELGEGLLRSLLQPSYRSQRSSSGLLVSSNRASMATSAEKGIDEKVE